MFFDVIMIPKRTSTLFNGLFFDKASWRILSFMTNKKKLVIFNWADYNFLLILLIKVKSTTKKKILNSMSYSEDCQMDGNFQKKKVISRKWLKIYNFYNNQITKSFCTKITFDDFKIESDNFGYCNITI